MTFLTYFHWVLWHKDCGGASHKAYLGAWTTWNCPFIRCWIYPLSSEARCLNLVERKMPSQPHYKILMAFCFSTLIFTIMNLIWFENKPSWNRKLNFNVNKTYFSENNGLAIYPNDYIINCYKLKYSNTEAFE